MGIQVFPEHSQFNEPNIYVKVNGLKPFGSYCILCKTGEPKKMFCSYANFNTNNQGEIDTRSTAALSGSYTGVDGSGLFWSLTDSPLQRSGARFLPQDITKAVVFTLNLIENHQKLLTDALNSPQLDCCTANRHILAIDGSVIRQPLVGHPYLRGTLFKPANASETNKYPAIIDMYGTIGGLIEYRAALLANEGFVVLALAYFGYEDIPFKNDFELEYMKGAVYYVNQLPCVQRSNLALLGNSFGGILAYNMSVICPEVKATVVINSSVVLFNPFTLKYKGEFIPRIQLDSSGEFDRTSFDSPVGHLWDFIFPIEKSNAKFLICCGMLDAVLPNGIVIGGISEYVRQKRIPKEQVTFMKLRGAGHLLEPPYFPPCLNSYHRFENKMAKWGGKFEQHAKDQIMAWQPIVNFLRSTLKQKSHL